MKNSTFAKSLICAVLLLLSFGIKAQTTLSVRVNQASDDHEEYLSGGNPNTGKIIGNLDIGSSDLEFGCESAAGDSQLVGMRFNNITIPKGAIISKAYIQFTVDATGKNTNPCIVYLQAEATDSAHTFSDTIRYGLSTRAKLADSIKWTVSNGGTWNVVGSATADQRTPNLAAFVQSLIGRNGWKSGNSMAFYLFGSGTREVEAFDGDAPKAPQLVIEYFMPVSINSRIASASDDLEEWTSNGNPSAGKTLGNNDIGSSDLEFGCESAAGDSQLVGMRFTNLNIPKGAVIQNAYIQFTVDATSKNTNPCIVYLKAEDNSNPITFSDTTRYGMSNRPKLMDSIQWIVSNGGTWNTVGSATPDQRTPNLKNLVQSLVNKSTWAANNAMAFYLYGSGTREVESFDGDAPKAAQLVVEYIPVTAISKRIAAASDDLEEYVSVGNPSTSKILGNNDVGSSDLEFGWESAAGDEQLVGLRFTDLSVPAGAIIQNAYIQFTVDATSKNTNPCVVNIKAEDNANPLTFSDTTRYGMSSRPKLMDSTQWTVSNGGTWNTVGSATADQRTPNLKNLVQTLVNKNGWNKGNAMAFYLNGTGVREVEAFDGDAPKAAQLVIEFLGDTTGGGPIQYVATPVTNFPIAKKAVWNYWDKTNKPSNNWLDTLNNDTFWAYTNAPLGYGDNFYINPIGFGGIANNKNITSWFRKTINVNTATLADTLELNLMCDDGAVVYVNGTQVLRHNMPTGVIDSNTLATKNVEGMAEMVFFTYDIPKTAFRNGKNVVALEVHQNSATSSDAGFDIEIKNRTMAVPTLGAACNNPNDLHISCFNSLMPIDKVDSMGIPSTHTFQRLVKDGDLYTNGNTVGTSFDFTPYVGRNGSSKNGWMGINYETNPNGGVGIFNVNQNCATGLWTVDSSQAVDFTTDIVRTERNCSGGITPWGTIVTAEESLTAGDANGDGYQDIGWLVEIDPNTKKVKQYGNGKNEKLWAFGRISHENACFKNDSLTGYTGEDDGTGNVFKFVANTKGNLSAGTLYVLKLDSGLLNNEPRATSGVWVVVPNTTITDRNNTKALAASLGGTFFNGIEDIEVNPVDGKIYFTAKGNNRVYRFSDNGSTASNFETYVGGKSYRLNTTGGAVTEEWGSGNDNLTFDSRGNLYVLQDGSRDHVWMIRNGHTQANPKVEMFMTTPSGSEPTGMTFTPDERFMFMSIQNPSPLGTTVQKDAAGNNVIINRNSALVIGRREVFTPGYKAAFTINDATQCLTGNSFVFTDSLLASNKNNVWLFGNGQSSTQRNATYSYNLAGNYTVKLATENAVNGCRDTATKSVTVYAKPSNLTITGAVTTNRGTVQSYTATPKTGATYQWWIENGTQTSGTNTNTISVTWSNIATAGKVSAQEIDVNTCIGDTANLTISLTNVGINDANLIAGLKIYPNPTKNDLFIESNENVTVIITDISGKKLFETKNQIGEILTIDLSAYSAGSYLVNISSNKHTVTRQIVKH